MSGSILYIHGFNSSPLSKKARQLEAVMQQLGLPEQLRVPALHHHPRQAIAQLERAIAELGEPLLVGSSLGGYYATYLAERHGLKALLINPAVHPSRDLARYIGEHPVWQDPAQSIFFEPAYVQELMELESQPLPTRPATLALIAKGDEVLDWREMLARHQTGQVRLIEGSDHALSDFEDHLPQILEFLQLA